MQRRQPATEACGWSPDGVISYGDVVKISGEFTTGRRVRARANDVGTSTPAIYTTAGPARHGKASASATASPKAAWATRRRSRGARVYYAEDITALPAKTSGAMWNRRQGRGAVGHGRRSHRDPVTSDRLRGSSEAYRRATSSGSREANTVNGRVARDPAPRRTRDPWRSRVSRRRTTGHVPFPRRSADPRGEDSCDRQDIGLLTVAKTRA